MGSFCGRSLSNVVYSLALSQQHPGEEWLAAAQARAVALGPSAFSPQVCACVYVCACGRQHACAGGRSSWVDASAELVAGLHQYTDWCLCGYMRRRCALYSVSTESRASWRRAALALRPGTQPAHPPARWPPQGLTQMAWGLAKLGCPPTSALLDMVCAHAAARLPRSAEERRRLLQLQALRDRSGFSSSSEDDEVEAEGAAAASSSGSRSGRKQQQQQQPRRPLAPYNGLDLSTLMYALGSWGAQPRPEVGRRLLLALEWELPRLEANQLCNCVWACARLRLYPSRSWLRDFYDASYRQLPYFKPVDLSQSLWALARLGAAPPEAWLGGALNRLQHTASMFSPVEVANTMWALAKMGVRGERLPAEVLALFFIATDRRLSSFKPQVRYFVRACV